MALHSQCVALVTVAMETQQQAHHKAHQRDILKAILGIDTCRISMVTQWKLLPWQRKFYIPQQSRLCWF